MKKRLFAALLAAAVCFTCLPAQMAFAEGEDTMENNAIVDTVPAENPGSEIVSEEKEPPAETLPEVEDTEGEAEAELSAQSDDAPVQERQQYPQDQIDGGDWYYALFGDLQKDFNIDRSKGLDKGELYNYRGSKKNVMLPYVYENVGTGTGRAMISIVKIHTNSFTNENASFVERVAIPDSVKTIESGAFTNSGLIAVWVPESVTEIGENAFPAGTKIYGYAGTAAERYAGEKFVAVDPNLDIRNGTLVDIKDEFSEKNLILPEVVFQFAASITHNYGQYTIETVTLSASFGGNERNDYIWALGSISNLDNIVVSESNPYLTSVDGCLFSKDKKTFYYYPQAKEGKEFAIPEGTEIVDSIGLWNAYKLEKVTVPASVTSMSAISSDTLKEIVVAEGNSVYSTENGVLYGPCEEGGPGMEDISGYGLLLYPAQKTGKAFTVPDVVNGKKVTIIGGKAFAHQKYLTEIKLSDNIIGAGNQAFIYCRQLKKITIPKNMTEIDISSPFTGCSDLTSIDIAEGNPRFKSIDGVMFSKDGTRLVAYPGGRKELFNTYYVPDGTKTIGRASFADNRSLQVVYIPEGVTTIESDAFGSCEALYAVHLPNSLVEIQASAFMWSRALSIVQLPQNGSLKTIGREAFRECDRLLAIKVPSSITTIQNLGGNPTNRYIFPEHTLVIAAKDSIMWQPDPANKGTPYGGKYLVTPYDFLRGDLNGDKKISMADMELLREYLRDNNFGVDKGIDAKSADANGDGKVDETDWAYLKDAITKGFQE